MNKYDSYKDSGIEWIGEIPSHWNIYKVKNLIDKSLYYQVGDGDHGSIKPEMYQEYGIPYIRVQNLSWSGKLILENVVFISEEIQSLNPKSKLLPNDILIAKTGATVGKLGLITDDIAEANTTSSVGKLTVDKNRFFPKYILYSFQADFFQKELWLKATEKSAQPGFNIDDFVLFKIASPQLSEQTIIANYLDQKTAQIDELIAKKERLIQLLEEERTAIINQAVTKGLDPTVPMKDSGIEWLGEIPAHWEVKKLKQIFNSSKGLTITKENLESEGIPCVNYGEIHSKFGFEVDIDQHQLKCVNPTYLESDYKSLIQTGDFVFADTSEDVSGAGNFTYLKSNHEIFAGYHTIILRALCNIESRYFAYQFDSIPYRTQIRQSVKGIKVFSVTQGILKNTSLWIPPLAEQKQIIEFLDTEIERIVRLKKSTSKEIELLKEFKTALISEVITGKVDVRNEKLS